MWFKKWFKDKKIDNINSILDYKLERLCIKTIKAHISGFINDYVKLIKDNETAPFKKGDYVIANKYDFTEPRRNQANILLHDYLVNYDEPFTSIIEDIYPETEHIDNSLNSWLESKNGNYIKYLSTNIDIAKTEFEKHILKLYRISKFQDAIYWACKFTINVQGINSPKWGLSCDSFLLFDSKEGQSTNKLWSNIANVEKLRSQLKKEVIENKKLISQLRESYKL